MLSVSNPERKEAFADAKAIAINMKTIASFTVNHDTLLPGLYVSRVDGDIVTYDVRMKVPNSGDYHLFATYARNSGYANQVVYVGPMGCRTGFYLLLRDSVSRAEAIRLVQDSFAFIAAYEGEIPGATRTQCGNYREHDLPGAKAAAAALCVTLRDWTPEKTVYESGNV